MLLRFRLQQSVNLSDFSSQTKQWFVNYTQTWSNTCKVCVTFFSVIYLIYTDHNADRYCCPYVYVLLGNKCTTNLNNTTIFDCYFVHLITFPFSTCQGVLLLSVNVTILYYVLSVLYSPLLYLCAQAETKKLIQDMLVNSNIVHYSFYLGKKSVLMEL